MDGRLKYVLVNVAELFADSALSLQLDVVLNSQDGDQLFRV